MMKGPPEEAERCSLVIGYSLLAILRFHAQSRALRNTNGGVRVTARESGRFIVEAMIWSIHEPCR